MDSDVKAAGGAALSPRAGIAMLTLQVRATLQEAATMEAQYVPIDHVAARQQLLEKLAPLIEERERAFDAELIAARQEAASVIAEARDNAAVISAQRIAAREAERAEAERLEAERLEAERLEAERAEAERLEAERLEAERLEAERLDAERLEAERLEAERLLAIAAVVTAVEPDLGEVDGADGASEVEPPRVDAPMLHIEPPFDDLPDFDSAPEPEPLTTVASLRPSEVLAPASSPAPINVTIDADAFARVFATVFASLVEQRALEMPSPRYMSPMLEAPAPQQPKQGFWSQARHPDVLLMGVATAIVLVVLAAWLV
ncbi:MAG: hypothetical protein HY828_15610 [Actinobacteria bacterium]|nr:hypothetical protein [Actinomycetota bacterium]